MTRKWRWAFPITIAIIGIIVGSFLDLQINQAIYSKGNWFGIGMAVFGTTPVYLMLSAVGVGFFLFALKDKRILMKIGLIVLAIVSVAASVYFQADMANDVNGFDFAKELHYIGYLIGLAVAALGGALGYVLFRNITDDKHALLVIFLMPIILALSILLVHFVKGSMARPRFRFIVAENDLTYYRNWWESGKALFDTYGPAFKEEFRSFPSGHTVTATSLIPFLAFLPQANKKYVKAEPFLFYGAFVLALIMAFSRMLVGAHFLSDTMMGMLVSSTVGLIVDLVAFRNPRVQDIKQETEEQDVLPVEE